MKVALFGDAVGIPQTLKAIPQKNICAIVASSIRPNSHQELQRLASDLSVPFLVQPRKKDGDYLDFVPQLAATQPEMLLCNSYSLLIREELRRLVEGHAINVHGALLPRNRGCNPIQWAIIKGETEFGVTMHLMDDSFDTGDIIAQRGFPIGPDMTWVEVRNRLWVESELLLKDMVPLLLGGHYPRMPQSKSEGTTNPRLTPDCPRIDFTTMSDRDVYNLIRAQVAPLAGAYVELDSGRIHIPGMISMEAVAKLRGKYAHAYSHTST